MREIERSAASVEEAVEAALSELGLSEQEAQIEIVQEPRSGFLGLNSSPAIVRVRALPREGGPRLGADDGDDEAGPSAEAAPSSEDVPPGEGAGERAPGERAPGERASGERAPGEGFDDDQDQADAEEDAELAADFLEGLLDVMDLDAEIELGMVDGTMYVDLWGPESSEDMGLLIGRHGHVLDALQELTRSAVQRRTGERCRVVVDVEDYRKRRKDQVIRRARDAARKVRTSGRPEALEPMGAFERKIVHDTIADEGDLETASEGQEPNRRVVVRRRRA
jgi:spoIIIJ-associated protein